MVIRYDVRGVRITPDLARASYKPVFVLLGLFIGVCFLFTIF